MRGVGLLACVLVVLAVTPAAVAGVVVPSGDAGAAAAVADAPFQTGRVEADGVLLRVDVDAEGDATWTVEYRIRLVDDNRTAAFESLRRDVRRNESRYRQQFANRMTRTAGAAENATGREMTVRNVSVGAETQQLGRGYGVVSYRFEWTSFARVEGDRVVVGDALAGLFLDSGTSLVVVPPEGYEVDAVEPEPDRVRESAVTWEGPTDFGAGEPMIRASPAGGGPATATVAAALALVAVVAVGAAWWRRSSGTPDADSGATAGPSNATAADGSGVATDDEADADDPGPTDTTANANANANAEPSPSEPSDLASTAADGTASTTRADAEDEGGGGGGFDSESDGESGSRDADGEGDDGADGGDEADDRVPLELLSPEERVMRLVRERGGRMKQQEVVSELEWSAARTSQVVSSLREEGTLETFRLGRENVLKLPEDGEGAA